jgi:hypothetical protein
LHPTFVDVETKEPATMGPADTARAQRRRHAVSRALAAVAVLLAAGVVIAGCGGGGKSPGVASVSTTNTSTGHSSTPSKDGGGGPELSGGAPSSGSSAGSPHSGFAIATGNPQKALKFSECMRANGVPGFPDPNGQGVIQGSGIDPQSSAFQRAQKACAKDMGSGVGPSPAQQATAEADALAFSKCMRSHGEPDFPDPTFSAGGGIRISISLHGGRGAGSELDPNSPIFVKAQKACQPLMQAGLPGAKTSR